MIDSPWRSLLLMLSLLVLVLVMAVFRLPPDAGEWLGRLRPDWIAIWVLYWVIAWEGRIGLLVMLPVGLAADALVGTTFGTQLSIVAMAAWVGLRFGEVYRSGPFGLAAIISLALFLASAHFEWLVHMLTGGNADLASQVAGSLVSVLLTTVLVVTLRRRGPPPALNW